MLVPAEAVPFQSVCFLFAVFENVTPCWLCEKEVKKKDCRKINYLSVDEEGLIMYV